MGPTSRPMTARKARTTAVEAPAAPQRPTKSYTMANETALWQWLRKVNRESLHMERIENSAALATPDVEGQAGPAGHFHLELKCLHGETNVGDGVLKFRVGQREWAKMRWAAGGAAWILVEGFEGDLYLIPGAFALMFKRESTVKTAFLSHLSYWTGKKSPLTRTGLFDRLAYSALAHEWVERRFQRDPQLRSASQPISELDQLLGSLPAS